MPLHKPFQAGNLWRFQAQEFPWEKGISGFLDFSQILLVGCGRSWKDKISELLKFPLGSQMGDGSSRIGMGAGNDSGGEKRDEDPGIRGSGMQVWNSGSLEGAQCTWREFPGKPFHGFQ